MGEDFFKAVFEKQGELNMYCKWILLEAVNIKTLFQDAVCKII